MHKDAIEFAKAAAAAGAGEIIINAVDLDGMMTGYDTNLIAKIAPHVSVPVVACGGAGSLHDLKAGYQAGILGSSVGGFANGTTSKIV